MKSIPICVFTLGCIWLTACSPSKPTSTAETGNSADSPASPGQQTGKLLGSAFVATEGGENIKLALLDVKAIDEKPMLDYLAKTDLSAEEITTSLRSVVTNAEGELKASQQEESDAEQQAASLKKEAYATAEQGGFGPFDSRPEMTPEDTAAMTDLQAEYAHYEEKGWHTLAADYAKDLAGYKAKQAQIQEQQKSWDQWRPIFDEQWAEYQLAGKKAAEWGYERGGASFRLDRAQARLQDWLNKDRFFAINLDSLPAPVATDVTDADGKFSLEIPTHGRFAIVATTQRPVGDDTERYLWLIWVSMDGATSKTVRLNNDNMINSANLDSKHSLSSQ